MYEEESKKNARVFQREKRQELQLIIERCNKIPFEYVCKPLERNFNIVFGSSTPRKIFQIAQDASVNSFPRRCLKEFFNHDSKKLNVTVSDSKENGFKLMPTVPFTSKVPRFHDDFILLDASQGYKRRKKPQEGLSKIKKNSAFGSFRERTFILSSERKEPNIPGPFFHFNFKFNSIIHHSFGGRINRTPAYEIVCTPKNQEPLCCHCENEVKNIYWKNSTNYAVYCRPCFSQKIHEIKNTPNGVLEKFRKLEIMENEFHRKRYCEFMHKHNNTKAAISLIPKNVLEKQLKKENFLSSIFKY